MFTRVCQDRPDWILTTRTTAFGPIVTDQSNDAIGLFDPEDAGPWPSPFQPYPMWVCACACEFFAVCVRVFLCVQRLCTTG